MKKVERIPENIELVRGLPCSVCRKAPPSDPHHWKTRGSGGSDDLTNLVSLCHQHHVECHAMGRRTFWEKFGDKIESSRRLWSLPDLAMVL